MHSQLTKITINCTAKQSRDSKGEKCSLSGGKIFVITRKEIKGALFEWPIIFMNTVLSPFPSSPSHTKKAVYQLLNRPRTEYWPGLVAHLELPHPISKCWSESKLLVFQSGCVHTKKVLADGLNTWVPTTQVVTGSQLQPGSVQAVRGV